MKPVVGLDIDDVLADLHAKIYPWHNRSYGTSCSTDDAITYNLWHVWGCQKEESIRRVFEFYSSDDFRNISPVRGAYDALHVLNAHARLIAITSRPSSIRGETERWLTENFPHLIDDVYFTNAFMTDGSHITKSSVCKEIGARVFVEDCLEYAIDCSGVVPVVLFDKPWNRLPAPGRIARVVGWDQALPIIEGYLTSE